MIVPRGPIDEIWFPTVLERLWLALLRLVDIFPTFWLCSWHLRLLPDAIFGSS